MLVAIFQRCLMPGVMLANVITGPVISEFPNEKKSPLWPFIRASLSAARWLTLWLFGWPPNAWNNGGGMGGGTPHNLRPSDGLPEMTLNSAEAKYGK
jgi:hypothetical protein